MKIVKCKTCKAEREVEDNVVMSICNCCQEEMKEVKNRNECFICGDTFDLENSHDIPQYIGGTDGDGIRTLCERHHREYDLYLLKKFLYSMNINPELNNYIEIIKWQCEIKKNPNLHTKLKEIARDIIKYYFNKNFKIEDDINYICELCGREVDVEDYLFNNFCDKCFNSLNGGIFLN